MSVAMSDLKPLDYCISYKPPEGWWPPDDAIRQIVYWRLRGYGRKIYGPDAYVEKDHVRIYVGIVKGVPLGFEFTSPAARFFEWEEWMNDQPYAHIMRRATMPDIKACDVFRTCLPYDGTPYDLGQLVDISLGTRLFDFGKKLKVCSVGGRIIGEPLLDETFFPEVEVERTPPCSWMNSSNWIDASTLTA